MESYWVFYSCIMAAMTLTSGLGSASLTSCRSASPRRLASSVKMFLDTRGVNPYSNDNFDWGQANRYWNSLIDGDVELPPLVSPPASSEYALTDVKKIEEMGSLGEFASKSNRYSLKKTYTLRIGYRGSEYSFGYQRQRNSKGIEEPRTVEGDVKTALGKGMRINCAGRTDGGVSAVSQILNFVSADDSLDADDILKKLRASDAAKEKRLVFYDCARAPRSFNARGSATWRRYLYMVPLIESQNEDLDVEWVDKVMRALEGKTLPFNSFAVGENRKTGEGLKDLCTMYVSRASRVSSIEENGPDFVCVELVGSRFLRRMVRLLVASAVREASKPLELRDENVLLKICDADDRSLPASAFPGAGLCFAGVGFNYTDFAFYKLQPKAEAARLRELFLSTEEVTEEETEEK